MTPAKVIGQFGDTTYTKVFVGGLAWETQKDTMRKYFEQFGEILEAVVITDKITGRSKGYGFVCIIHLSVCLYSSRPPPRSIVQRVFMWRIKESSKLAVLHWV